MKIWFIRQADLPIVKQEVTNCSKGQSKKTGFHDIIHKPFTPEEIETALGKVL